jgi:hypothetical protein
MHDSEGPIGWSSNFDEVLDFELDRLDGCPLPRRPTIERSVAKPETPAAAAEPSAGPSQGGGLQNPSDRSASIARAHKKQLVGLAFSGGGIRSATFNLGVLQALARLQLLDKFDYLSTVSGGGYIGSWLMAWMKRRGVDDVRARLRPERGRQAGGTEPSEIHFLRRFSNYLTPKLGWLGADMWTVIAVYVRNLLLNLIVLSSAFAFVLMVPRVFALLPKYSILFLKELRLFLVAHGLAISKDVAYYLGFGTLALVALVALAYAANRIVSSMRYFGVAQEKNAGREVRTTIEAAAIGWRNEAGEGFTGPFEQGNNFSWYTTHLDDFVLDLRFRFSGDGRASIFIWSPVPKGAKKPEIKDAVLISIAGPDQPAPCTGAIGQQEPKRSASIRPGWNDLEITAVDGRCTVRVNGRTTNTAQIDLRGRAEKNELLGGVIAIERDEVEFKELTLTKIESASVTGATQGDVQRRIVLPLFIATIVLIFLYGFGDNIDPAAAALGIGPVSLRQWLGLPAVGEPVRWWLCAFIAGSASAALVFAGQMAWAYRHRKELREKAKAKNERWLRNEIVNIRPAVIAIFGASGIGGILGWGLFKAFAGRTYWEVLVWGPPALMAAFLATTILLIGLLGRTMRDERREWWSRLSAWLLIYSLGWVGVFGIAFYGPVLLREIAKLGNAALGAVTMAWVISTLSGLVVARGAQTGPEKPRTITDLIANLAPYVFVAGFVLLLSYGVDVLVADVSQSKHTPGLQQAFIADQWRVLYHTDWRWVLALTLGFAVIAIGLSVCLDINQFSMHMLYRNRLGRCYLGASNRLRRAQPFTGFSSDDDLELDKLGELKFCGPDSAPYPIINAALNLVGGQELAWQQRKAASFVFTPFFCGYEFPDLPPGYCKTESFARKSLLSKEPTPVTLATAMAISGAAASPNMGYHSAPAPAFLMTVFNVRLGWWLGNPRKKDGYDRSGPLNVILRLMSELFGLTNERGKYVYLSDGGHFENLGIYELVRRRCRFIVACDAEEDHTFGFGGLGNAIEKCRSDFGVDIDVDVEPIRRRSEKGQSDWHCAIGTIHYSRVDRDGRDGILVYLKSSLTGDEPTDVLRYAAANPGFPHQSTSDQWFDESQFESYRMLGFHIAEEVFGALGDRAKLKTLTKEDLFVELAEAWHPPSGAPPDAFTKHTRTVVKICDELRENEHLDFLSEQIYPEWWVLLDSRNQPETLKPLRDQLPGPEGLKAGFYLCNSVIQLFEDVYVDLNLEDEYDHPDNRGWMNLFKHWSWSAMLRVTWTISASTYGARFQTFCERHLGLKIGEVKAPKVEFGARITVPDANAPYQWSDEIAVLSGRIEQAIWKWLKQLPVGSKMAADAALKATEQAPGTKIDRKTISEEAALVEANGRTKAALDKKIELVEEPPRTGRNDEEWFVAAILLELCRRRDVPPQNKTECAEMVARFIQYNAAVITSRFKTKNFDKELNAVERELIQFFFVFNPGLAASATIHRFEVTPDPRAASSKPTQRNLNFPFGFAIFADTRLQKDEQPRKRLVYLRVQDHVRRMGLAREALAKMMDDDEKLEADLKKMHPDAHEVPTDKERARFMRLFDSVKSTVVQKNERTPPQFE